LIIIFKQVIISNFHYKSGSFSKNIY